MSSEFKSLNIIIVGSGIAGLTAAITCKRAGHNVQIYERSGLNNEIGAGIHVCPNASGGLLDYGLDPERAQFIKYERIWIADATSMETIRERDDTYTEDKYGAPWYMAHRLNLHEELKRMAKQEGAVVHLNSPVMEYDPEGGAITLSDGSVVHGDLIIAADGVHTAAVKAILGSPNPPIPNEDPRVMNFSFRFQIPSEIALSDPIVAEYVKTRDNCFKVFLGEGKRMIWYSCRNNELQNCAVLFHNPECGTQEVFGTHSDKSTLLSIFHDFHPDLKRMLEMATEIRQWPLLYRNPIPTWHKGRLVAIGDAAHPMLPHHGQGGAQAIEDGLALGIILSGFQDNDAQTISKRLEIFEEVRRTRASLITIFSRVGGDQAEMMVKDAAVLMGDKPVPQTPEEFFDFFYSHNVREESVRAMQEAIPGWKAGLV